MVNILLCYFTQLQFMIGQDRFLEFRVSSRTTAEFEQPERSASFVYIQLRLKSAYHLLTIVSNVAESE